MPRLVQIAEGKRIKVPSALLSRFESEVEKANKILQERKKTKRKQTNAEADLQFRVKDLGRFKTKRSAMKYIKTTHEIVTGKFFNRQRSVYRANLLSSLFKSWGFDPGNTKLSVFNIKQYQTQISKTQYDLAVTIATLNQEQIEKLSKYGNINLIQYQYQPTDNEDEIMQYLIDILNKKGAVFEEAKQFDAIQRYRRAHGL